MAYQTNISVHFGEVDPAQIVYYPNIFHYCHIAFERFFADFVGITYPRLLTEERLGFPAVRTESNFERRIKYGENIEMQVSVRRIGKSSVEFYYQGLAADGGRFFEAAITVVAVNMDNFQPVPIPEKYVEIFGRCQEEQR